MDILIDDTHYHLEEETKEELSFVNGVIASLFSTYPGERQCLDDIYKHAGVDKSNEKASFEYKVIKAILKSLKDRFGNTLQREQLLKLVKTTLNKELPYVLENEKDFITSRHIYYEPEFVYSYYLATRIRKEVDTRFATLINEDEKLFVLLLNSVARSIKSAITVVSLGDDVHGMSIFRGIIEMTAVASVAPRYFFDWARFKRMEGQLYVYKNDANALTDELSEFFREFGINPKNPDKALKFVQTGWAKKKDGQRCCTIKELIDLAFNSSDKDNYESYKIFSIMVHESYFTIPFDWTMLRKNTKEISNYSCMVFKILMEGYQWFNAIDNNAFKYLNNFNEIDWENI